MECGHNLSSTTSASVVLVHNGSARRRTRQIRIVNDWRFRNKRVGWDSLNLLGATLRARIEHAGNRLLSTVLACYRQPGFLSIQFRPNLLESSFRAE